MPSILSVSGRAWQRAHQRHRTDDGAFQETCHDEEIQAEQSPETAASPPAAAAATRSAHAVPVTQIPPENADQVAMTTTGEIMQLIRLHYEVEDIEQLRALFASLRCLEYDASQTRWVWLYTEEARTLPFKDRRAAQERGIRGIRLQRADGQSCSTSAPLNAPPTPWSSLTTIFPGRSRVSPR